MITIDGMVVKAKGHTNELVKELCYALIALRYKALDKAREMELSEKEIDSQFKMIVLGGMANSLSDEEDGYISEENVAQKLFEITERAYANKIEGAN